MRPRPASPDPGFPALYIRMFHRPTQAFRELFQGDRSLRYGLFALLVPAIGYTLFYWMAWAAGGSPSTFLPWLALPAAQYFRYDIFLTLPGYYLSWIGASGTVHLLCRTLKGRGTFDQQAAVIGFGVGIASWSSLLHDLTDAILSITGVIDMKAYEQFLNEPTFWRGLLWTLYTLYFFWMWALFATGIRLSQGFSRSASLLIGFAGLAIFQTILLIFIR